MKNSWAYRRGINCAYSFSDLFFAAENRMPSEEELTVFAKMTQGRRNQAVKRLAEQADWNVEDRSGADDIIYTAFWPKTTEESK